VSSRIWLDSLTVAIIAALAAGLTYFALFWIFTAALFASWGDANFRAQIANDAAQLAAGLKRQHQSQKQIATALVDLVRSVRGYDAAVVSDRGAVIAGNGELAERTVPVFLPPRDIGEHFGIGPKPLPISGEGIFVTSGAPPGGPPPNGPPPNMPANGPPTDIVFRGGPMPPGAQRQPWNVLYFAMRRPGQEGLDPSRLPVSIVRIEGASLVIARSVDLFADLIVRMRWIAFALATVAFGLTLVVAQRSLRHATRPFELVRSALTRLGRGDYSRLSAADPNDGVTAEFISAYNAAAEELAESAAQRQEVEANSRRFVADAGHELRTPLAVITGYVDLLRQSSSNDDPMERRIFSEIQGQGERMRALIANMLFLMRLDSQEPGDVKIIDAADIVHSVIDSFQAIANGATLRADTPNSAFLQISENELRQAVGNLIDNALKYAPGATITALVRSQGDQVVVSVSDDGPGMSPDVRARAFERFARGETSGSVPGSGLGLAIVARTVERAGGTISLNTEPGRGVTVEMRFPAWKSAA